MSNKDYVELTLPAGKYFIGDPCYVIADEKWDEVSDQMFPGIVGHPDYENHDIVVDGIHFFAYSTAYGDGLYDDFDNFKYPVDSGSIGAVPFELVSKREGESLEDYGRIIEVDQPLRCIRDENGTFIFVSGDLRIDIETGFEEYDDEDEEYDNDE